MRRALQPAAPPSNFSLHDTQLPVVHRKGSRMKILAALALTAACLVGAGAALAAEPPAAPSATPVKHTSLAVCNKQADGKKLTGPERARFVKECRAGKSS
jgi:psiF repeat